MRYLVTGGAGFIGSTLCESLIKNNHEVVILDDFSAGSRQNIRNIIKDIELIEGSCLVESHLTRGLKDVDYVIHLAANPEVRLELNNSENCFNRNVLATYKLLEAIKETSIDSILFTSTSTVYGQSEIIPTPLSLGKNLPISFYGGSKLASEALISAYAHMYNKKAIIIRLANIVGARSGHGVIFDFINKLKKNPTELSILGNGKQVKSYLYIDDLITALNVLLNSNEKENVAIYNIGSNDQITVTEIARKVIKGLNLQNVKLQYSGGTKSGGGWKGDVTNMLLDISKMLEKEWKPTLTSGQAIEKTVNGIISQRN